MQWLYSAAFWPRAVMAKLNSSGEHINGSLHIYVGAFTFAKLLQKPLSKLTLELLFDLCCHDVFEQPAKPINNNEKNIFFIIMVLKLAHY